MVPIFMQIHKLRKPLFALVATVMRISKGGHRLCSFLSLVCFNGLVFLRGLFLGAAELNFSKPQEGFYD